MKKLIIITLISIFLCNMFLVKHSYATGVGVFDEINEAVVNDSGKNISRHRFTLESLQEDDELCAIPVGLVIGFIVVYTYMYISIKLFKSIPPVQPTIKSLALANMIASISTVLVYVINMKVIANNYSLAVNNKALNSKVVNTIDKGKCKDVNNMNNCCPSLQELYKKKNQEVNGVKWKSWEESGPLKNYCYNKAWDNSIAVNNLNADIYGKIGISYNGAEPVWIAANDCEPIINSTEQPRILCASGKGDKICAEIVYCSGIGSEVLNVLLKIPPAYPANHLIGHPEKKKTRKCGVDNEGNTIDDYLVNGRCECACCPGSDSDQSICSATKNTHRSCETYDKDYGSNCAYLPEELTKARKIETTGSVHSFCNTNYKLGYKHFSFSGRVVRCFSETFKNILHGTQDVLTLDSDANVINVNKICQGGETAIDSDGICTASLLLKSREGIADIIGLLLILWVLGMGFYYLKGGKIEKKHLMLNVIRISLVLYFSQGTAWHDGYYNFLTNASYEVSSDFMKIATTSDETKQAMFRQEIPVNKTKFAQCAVTVSYTEEEFVNKLKRCNFFVKSRVEADGISSFCQENDNSPECKIRDSNNIAYQEGQGHYAILDAIDCKFAYYIGKGEGLAPNIIFLGIAFVFKSFTGFFILMALWIFFFKAIAFLLQMTLSLVMSLIYITILVFISPVIIPMILLKSTEPIFKKWLKNLMGYSVQPILILVFVSIIIALLDIFFARTLAIVYQYNAEYYNLGFGIKYPIILGDIDSRQVFWFAIQFVFLIIVIEAIFNEFNKVISSLSGVSGDVSSITKPIADAYNKTTGAVKSTMYGGAKLAAGKARDAVISGFNREGEDKKGGENVNVESKKTDGEKDSTLPQNTLEENPSSQKPSAPVSVEGDTGNSKTSVNNSSTKKRSYMDQTISLENKKTNKSDFSQNSLNNTPNKKTKK